MISFVEYLNLPAKVGMLIIGAFLVTQLVGEFLECKGKVVPEFVKVRKIFTRKKRERKAMKEVPMLLDEVKKSLNEMQLHYNEGSFKAREEWMRRVDEKLDQHDRWVKEFIEKLDKNNSDTLSLVIDGKRNAIISFASRVINENSPVTREEFNRIFKMYKEYEEIIEANGLTNGEVDVAYRIVQESYEAHMRNHSFVEDIRGYAPRG